MSNERFENPGIIITSPIDSDCCEYVSDGWFEIKFRHLPEAQAIKAKADAAIDAATDIPDAIEKLTAAGFTVEHNPGHFEDVFGPRGREIADELRAQGGI